MALPTPDDSVGTAEVDVAITVESLTQITNRAANHDPNRIGPNNPRPGPPKQATGLITKPAPLT